MSKFAILSDIHGNLPALRAVLNEVDSLGVEVLAVAGDIIGGKNSRECLELVQNRGALAVLGNHESYADRAERLGLSKAQLDEAAGPVHAALVRTIRELSSEQMQWIRQLNLVENIAPNTVMAHASLHEPERWRNLRCAKDARPTLDLMMQRGIDLALLGHSHRQEWFAHPEARVQPFEDDNRLFLRKGSICAVAVGSVGQPRDRREEDWDLWATWVLWDRDARVIEFRITSYLR